jgi:hypothetical protein
MRAPLVQPSASSLKGYKLDWLRVLAHLRLLPVMVPDQSHAVALGTVLVAELDRELLRRIGHPTYSPCCRPSARGRVAPATARPPEQCL